MFLEHMIIAHEEQKLTNLDAFREFRGFIVELGGGHLELNCRRSILSSPVIYESFVKKTMMAAGFSEVQANYQALSRDNHKYDKV